MMIPLSPSVVGRVCKELPELPLPTRAALGSPRRASFSAVFSILVEKSTKSAQLVSWEVVSVSLRVENLL